MSPDEFWQHQLSETAARAYTGHVYPVALRAELERIRDYCRDAGINLAFIIPPTHVELQARTADFGMEAEVERFRRDIATLGTVYDFDYPCEITTQRADYADPYHCRPRVRSLVIQEVWGDPAKRRYVHVLRPE
jgi:hypothetical protein